MPTLQEQIEKLRKKIAARRALQELGEDHSQEIAALETELQALVNTEGGAFVDGNVNTRGGDFVGRDKIEAILNARCAYRDWFVPGYFCLSVGFRCIVSTCPRQGVSISDSPP